MKVTDIRMMLLKGPRYHGMGGIEGERYVMLVRVDTDAGVYGLGELEYVPGVAEAVEYIKDCMIGRSPMDIRPMYSEILYGTLPPHSKTSRFDVGQTFSSPFMPCPLSSPTDTVNGPMLWGLSGVEMALCDLVGKVLNTPVYNLLGGKFRDRVRIYLDRSCPADIADIAAWKKMAADAVNEGFTAIKFDAEYVASDYAQDVWNRSIPQAQINHTVERLAAVREAVGDDVELMLDFHMLFNVADAIRLANELSHLKLRWIEDPTPISNPDACAEVRQKSPIPVCIGEKFNVEEMRLFIDHNACDIVHPDVLFCGGLHEARRIGDLAELNYIPMAMHGNGSGMAAKLPRTSPRQQGIFCALSTTSLRHPG